MKRSPILRKSRLKKTNPARRKREFARAYHSKERVAFVQALPCAVCGWTGGCENAHIKTGGTGRKADYTQIVPLCGARPATGGVTIGRGDGFDIGCHAALHSCGRRMFEKAYYCDLDALAKRTENFWLSSLGSSPGGET